MNLVRRKTKVVKIGTIAIGGNNPIAIQSMAKTLTADTEATGRQLCALEEAGCEIVRVAVKNSRDARAIKEIKKRIRIPLVADIHFNWRLAIEAIENGADKIRLNPGNINKAGELRCVVSALKQAHIPLRVGVNSGSVEKAHTRKKTMAEKLAAGCIEYVRRLEKMKFYDIVISLKASTVKDTVEAYRQVSRVCDYPMHLGVTATGAPGQGVIKSAIACGILLAEGIGDTLRISLTDKPQEEVAAAKAILAALEIRHFGPEIISCPTCGRCEVDLVTLVKQMESKLAVIGYPCRKAGCRQAGASAPPVKLAIMGCVVNGPGEAREADIGVAFGKKDGLFFKLGKPVRKVGIRQCQDLLLKETTKFYDAPVKK